MLSWENHRGHLQPPRRRPGRPWPSARMVCGRGPTAPWTASWAFAHQEKGHNEATGRLSPATWGPALGEARLSHRPRRQRPERRLAGLVAVEGAPPPCGTGRLGEATPPPTPRVWPDRGSHPEFETLLNRQETCPAKESAKPNSGRRRQVSGKSGQDHPTTQNDPHEQEGPFRSTWLFLGWACCLLCGAVSRPPRPPASLRSVHVH